MRPNWIPGRTAAAAVVVGTVVLVAGCGSGSSSVSQQTSSGGEHSRGPAGASSVASARPSTRAEASDDTKHTLVKSGFGVTGEYAWVSAVVRNDSNKVGGTVVVNFNLFDAAGAIIVSGDQTEAFSRTGQPLVLGTQLQVPAGATPSKVEATAQVKYPGIGPTEAFPELPIGPVTVAKSQYGGFEASATLTNPTADALNNPRIGVICLNAAGEIIGGSSIFPDLVPPNGQVKVTTNSLIVTGEPASCEMYAGSPF